MGGKSQTVTNKAEPWKAAQPFLTGALGQAQDLFQQGKFSATPYEGTRVAGFSPATAQAQSGIMGQAALGAPGIDAARSTLMGMMNPGEYSGAGAVRQNILGSAIPAAASMFSGSGMTNSSTAMEGVGRAATEALAPFEYGAYENAQGRRMQAAGMMPAMEQAAYLPFEMQSQVGAQQDAMSQALAQAEMDKYYEGQGQAAANFSPYLNAIMGLGGMGGTQSTKSPVPGTGLGSAITGGLGMYGSLLGAGLTGGAATGGGILAALAALCDRRAKEDIQRIGQLDNGTAVYRFRYKGLPKVHIGVMADEVPHAIVGKVDGFDVIDYARV